jgi:acetyl esterase/lipase
VNGSLKRPVGKQKREYGRREKRMKVLMVLLLCGAVPIGAAGASPAAGLAFEVQRSRTYVERESGSLAGDVYLPKGQGPFPGMLVVHGGAWAIGSRSQLTTAAKAFAEHGYTTVAISYRLAPHYKFPAQIYDCQAAVRWMRSHASELKIDPKHIGGYGYSAGGHLVALLGTLGDKDLCEKGVPNNAPSARLQVVLAGGAPCDFRLLPGHNEQLSFWLGGSRSEKPDAYRDASPTSFITADDPPMFFFHGDQDWIVPVGSPRRMVGLLTGAGVTAEMYTVKNAGHIHTLFDRQALENSLAFADRYLKPKEAVLAGNRASGAATGGQRPGGASNAQ